MRSLYDSLAANDKSVATIRRRRWEKGQFEAWKEMLLRQALADPDLSPAAKNAFAFVLLHVNRNSLGSPLKVETIAAGISRQWRQAQRAITELVRRGYLGSAPRPGHSNFYWLAPPPSEVLASLASSDAAKPKVRVRGTIGNGCQIRHPRSRVGGVRSDRGGVSDMTGVRPGEQLTEGERGALARLAALNGGDRPPSPSGAIVHIMEVKPSLAELAHGAAALVEAIR